MIFGLPPGHHPHRRHRYGGGGFRRVGGGFGPRYDYGTYIEPIYVPVAVPSCMPDSTPRLPPCAGTWVRRGNNFCCEV